MLNQMVLVGKVIELPQLKETANGTKIATLVMEVDRNFRNSNGEYEKDHFAITLWRGIAEQVCTITTLGAIIAVKGRMQAKNYEPKENQLYYNLELIAEKVSFLSPHNQAEMSEAVS